MVDAILRIGLLGVIAAIVVMLLKSGANFTSALTGVGKDTSYYFKFLKGQPQ